MRIKIGKAVEGTIQWTLPKFPPNEFLIFELICIYL